MHTNLNTRAGLAEQTIRKLYKKKSLKLHPDKNRDDPDAQDKFALLNEALQNLVDPVKRIDHNKELDGRAAGWGYDRQAAAERARQYQWKHPGATTFDRGEQGKEVLEALGVERHMCFRVEPGGKSAG